MNKAWNVNHILILKDEIHKIFLYKKLHNSIISEMISEPEA